MVPHAGNRRPQNPERIRATIRTARPLERCFLHQAHTPTIAMGYDTFRLVRVQKETNYKCPPTVAPMC
jgi:hypothetical protein